MSGRVSPFRPGTQSASTRIGTRAGRVSTIEWPNRRAIAKPSPVVPLPGYERPPTATITRCAWIVASGSRTAKPSSTGSTPRAGELQRRVAPDRPSLAVKAASTSVARSETGKTLPLPSIFVATPSASKSATVASTLSAFNAGPRNFPPAPKACWMLRAPWAWRGSYAGSIGPETTRRSRRPRALVRLHRVPPDIRILTPGRRFFSSKTTRRPQLGGPDRREEPRGPRARIATSKS